jgi:ACT domain-containing protein
MRKIITLFLAMTLASGLTNSCKVLDVKKDITFEIDLTVNETDATWDEFEVLDAVAESNAIEDYADLLKDIELVKVEYTVTYFNGPSTQQINTATLEVADASGNGAALLGTVSNENLEALTTTTKEIVLDNAGVNLLEQLILESPHTVGFHYFGSANSAPMDFVVKFYVTVKMTANPL